MSSDFERLLRDARRALPGPDPEATRRARSRAVGAIRKGRSLRGPAVALVAAALVGVGVPIGAVIAPSGTAAPAAVGLGFLPEPGWSVVQNGGDGTPANPAVAIAANVALSPEDDAAVLPLSTLQSLPPGGVVIVVIFTARGEQPWHDQYFASRRLPLRASEAAGLFGAQVRPARPLGQYALRVAANGYNVDANIYYGTERPPAALVATAQRQLDRLVIREQAPRRAAPVAVLAPRLAVSSVVDRTFSCSPRDASVVASPHGSSELLGRRFISSGFLRVTAGRDTLLSDLAAVAFPGLRAPDIRFPAGVYASSRHCVPSRAPVPLTQTGLLGPPTVWRTELDCSARGRLLIRVRAVVNGAGTWAAVGTTFVGTRARVLEGQLAVRDQATGKPLAFGKLGREGATKLWSSARCT